MAPLCRGQKIEQKIFNDLFRSNIRDKYKIDAPVNEEEEESEEEDDDGFSGQRKKEEVEEDPVERKPNVFFYCCYLWIWVLWADGGSREGPSWAFKPIICKSIFHSEAKALAEKQLNDAKAMAQEKCVLQ